MPTVLLLPILLTVCANLAWATQPSSVPNAATPNQGASIQHQGGYYESVIDLKPNDIRPDGTKIMRGRVDGEGKINDNSTHVYEGIIAPGHSPGCIIDPGNVVLSPGARLLIEVGGAVACAGYDQFIVQQSLTINNATLQVSLINGFTPTTAQRFKILGWGSLTGSFGSVDLALAALPPGYSWNTSELYTTGELVVNGPAAPSTRVPMPDWALAVLAAGLLTSGHLASRRLTPK